MALTKEMRAKTITDFRKHAKDTGSSVVQIALLTERINYLTEHLKTHKKDHHTRRGLVMMVSKRRRHLDYVKGSEYKTYLEVIKKLKLRK